MSWIKGGMNWTKENLENAVKGALNKADILRALGKRARSYTTLNKYLKKYSVDCSHLKPKCTSVKSTNGLKVYSKDDKHPSKDLYFWQYRYDRVNTNSFETWYNKEDYSRADETHRIANRKYVRKNIFSHLIRTCLGREKDKPRRLAEESLIDESFIREMWDKQGGMCYWFNIPMKVAMQDGTVDLFRVSIDRVDSLKGYTKNNVVLCCHFANRGKGDAKVEDWSNLLKLIKSC